jgi:ABC-type antimicrobial peptide transport system permease subunit
MGDNAIRIVGLVPTIKYRSLAEASTPHVYLPHLQADPAGTAMWVRLRPGIDRAPIVARVRRDADAISPGTATLSLTFFQATEGSVAPQKLGARLLGALGALALFLSSIGIYGLMSYSVNRRTREIGIRMALGARPSNVLGQIVGEGMRLAAVGIALGLAAAAGATRLLGGILIGESPTDPAIFAAVAAILVATAFAANAIPALRAASVSPMTALRDE